MVSVWSVCGQFVGTKDGNRAQTTLASSGGWSPPISIQYGCVWPVYRQGGEWHLVPSTRLVPRFELLQKMIIFG